MSAIGAHAGSTVRASTRSGPRRERTIFTKELPDRARRGDLFIDTDDQLWRAASAQDTAGKAHLEWRLVDLVTARTRAIVRALAAGMAAAALTLFLSGPAVLQWLGPEWGWPLTLILFVLAAIAVVIADVAITAQSRMVTIESITALDRKEPR